MTRPVSLLLLLLSVVLASAPVIMVRGPVIIPATAAGGNCTPVTNAMTVNALASFGNTSNFTSYATASVTPSSNAFLVLAIAETANVGPTSVTNTGANRMTWTKAKS